MIRFEGDGGIAQEDPMRKSWMLIVTSVIVFVAAFTARHLLVPDVVPIAAADMPQPLWALETAFLLRATENIAAFGAVLLLGAAAVRWVAGRSRRAV
jgi:hypothetical protein